MAEESKTPLTLEALQRVIQDLKNDLRNEFSTKEEMEENTNLLIVEFSKDMRNMEQRILNEIKAFRDWTLGKN